MQDKKEIRIIYGISGHGNGHITRSMYIAEYLKKHNYKIKIFTFGQGSNYIKKYTRPVRYKTIKSDITRKIVSNCRSANDL